MKLQARNIDGFLKAPDATVAALFYGPDEGLVRERATILARTVLGGEDDPFAKTDLAAKDVLDDPARIADEMQSPTLLGGRRLITLSSAPDGAAAAIESALGAEQLSGYLIVTAGELRPQSRLRKLFEGAANAAAIACYADKARDLDSLIRGMIREGGFRIEEDAVAFLLGHLGSDRMVTRGEIEKLMLYKGDRDSAITVADAMAAVGDSAALAVEDVLEATTTGNMAGLDLSLRRMDAAGESPIGLLRVLARRLQRLHLLVAERESGKSLDAALSSLTPRSFWPESDALKKAAGHWTASNLATAMSIVLEAEEGTKRTGFPAEAICAQACLRIAGAARRAAKRS